MDWVRIYFCSKKLLCHMLWNLFDYLSCSILIFCIVCTPNWMKKFLNCCTTSFLSLPKPNKTKTQTKKPLQNIFTFTNWNFLLCPSTDQCSFCRPLLQLKMNTMSFRTLKLDSDTMNTYLKILNYEKYSLFMISLTARAALSARRLYFSEMSPSQINSFRLFFVEICTER